MNIKTNKERGFTIVELLIVIVVIGILAAITIVAYNGVQNRSRLSAAQSSANTIMKKAEAVNAVTGSYPTTAANFSANAESAVASQGITLASAAPTSSNGTNTVTYEACTAGATGGRVNYYDFVAGTAASKYIYVGAASTGCTTWGTPIAIAG